MEDKKKQYNYKDNKSEIFNYANLEILTRLYCFREELKEKINNYNKIKPEERIQTFFLINKELINNILIQLNYKLFVTAINNLKKSKNIKDKNIIISSEELDKNGLLLKIIIELMNQNMELANKIKNTKLKINQPNMENSKIMSSEQGNLKLFYYDEFEIVNAEICKLIRDALSYKYLGNLCKCVIGKNYIFIQFYLSSIEIPTITQICKYDKNINFVSEYVINIENAPIFQHIKSEGIDKMIAYFNKNANKNIYEFEKNNKIYYYKLEKNKSQNIIIDQTKKINKLIISDKKTTLSKLVYLYCHYFFMNEEINKRNNYKPFVKVYLINHKTFIKMKKDLEYKMLKDELNEKINKKDLLKTAYLDLVDINGIIKLLLPNTIQKYQKKKIVKTKDLEIEPKIISKFLNENDNILIYNNFEILDLESIQNFFDKFKEIENIESKCSYMDGYVIIHLPKYLNKDKYITLIGKLESDSKKFNTSFIFIFQKEREQQDYIENLMYNKFNDYLNSIKEEYSPINSGGKIIGTIIKNNEEIQEKKERVKRGLENIGATCYMNSTLQCFAHIKDFVEYFKKDKNKIKAISNKETLSYSFKILIDKLWTDNTNEKKYYAPYEFKEKISKLNPLFEGIAANDAKDLINFIVMTLHEELNLANDNNNIFADQILDQTNKTLMFQLFVQEFTQKYNSLSSRLFYAINYNITQCTECGIQLYNYQIYFFLIFPLEEVRKFVYYNNNNSNNNNLININQNVVDIYQCFEFDRRVCLMSGENAMFCNRCQRNTNSNICTNLVYAPNILIIILNRGKGKEFDVKLNFREDLDISNYVEINNTGTLYKLIGVITHLGESGMSGHFIAFCKDPDDFKWYKFNDAIVTPVIDFQKEVIDFGMPYLLFYQKNN